MPQIKATIKQRKRKEIVEPYTDAKLYNYGGEDYGKVYQE